MTYNKQPGTHVVEYKGKFIEVWDFAKNNWMTEEDQRLIPKSEAVYSHRKHITETELTEHLKELVGFSNSMFVTPKAACTSYEMTDSLLTQADYQLLKEILKEVLDPLEFRIKHKQGFTHTEVKRLVTKRNKIAQLQWKVKKAIT